MQRDGVAEAVFRSGALQRFAEGTVRAAEDPH